MTYQDILSTEDCCLPKSAEVLFPSNSDPRWCVVYEGNFVWCDTLSEVAQVLLSFKNQT
jgi:hypothetical protein